MTKRLRYGPMDPACRQLVDYFVPDHATETDRGAIEGVAIDYTKPALE